MINLQLMSQIGIILFMFIVGTEIDLYKFRNKAHIVPLISHAGIAVP